MDTADDLIGCDTVASVLAGRLDESQRCHRSDPGTDVGVIPVGEDEQGEVGVVLANQGGQSCL